ncbi:hypothetical protein LCGC14_1905560 [marine sediment metagenome]|uniref:Uncharacterized protein n=1 Tax=marine sediment metagenome TaxID=412755 RepID=A0A0F9ITF4_9ZZZZ
MYAHFKVKFVSSEFGEALAYVMATDTPKGRTQAIQKALTQLEKRNVMGFAAGDLIELQCVG